MQHRKLFFSTLFLALLTFSTSAFAADAYKVTMIFGLSFPKTVQAPYGGGEISKSQWNAFVINAITPAFSGFTVVDSLGYWKGEAENSKVVTVIASEADVSKSQAIADAYVEAFGQDAVLVFADILTHCSFVEAEEEKDCVPD